MLGWIRTVESSDPCSDGTTPIVLLDTPLTIKTVLLHLIKKNTQASNVFYVVSAGESREEQDFYFRWKDQTKNQKMAALLLVNDWRSMIDSAIIALAYTK